MSAVIDPVHHSDDDLPPGLQGLEASLVAQIDGEQGRWRRLSTTSRVVRLALPLLGVVVAAAVIFPGGRMVSPSVWAALLTSSLALAGVIMAPFRPGLGERLAQGAVVVAVVATVLQLATITGGGGNAGVGCLSIASIVALLASALTLASLASSGLPLRFWHRIGLGTAALFGACTAVWHHCAADTLVHVALGHVAGPIVVVAVILGLAWRRRSTSVLSPSALAPPTSLE